MAHQGRLVSFMKLQAVPLKNRNYAIAGAGAVLAIVAFFLPMITVSDGSPYHVGTVNGAQSGIIYWLAELLAVGIGIVAALFLFRGRNPFGTLQPLAKQVRWAAYAFTGGGGLSFSIVLLGITATVSRTNFMFGTSIPGLSVSWGIGSWLFLLGMAAVMITGVFMLIGKAIGAGVMNPADQYSYQDNGLVPDQSPKNPPTGYSNRDLQQLSHQISYPLTQYPTQSTQYSLQEPPQYQ